MLYFVIAMPCPFSDWCSGAVAQMARRAGEAVDIIPANTLDELAQGLLSTHASSAVVSARYGGGRLCAALIESGQPFLVISEHPRAALADLVLRKSLSLPQAVSAVASASATLANYSAAPGALRLSADQDSQDRAQAAAAIAAHFGFVLPPQEPADIARRGADDRHGDAVRWWNSLSPGQRDMAEAALAGQGHAERASLFWPVSLFQSGDPPGRDLDGPIDITGRARCLLQGPFILLRQGNWRLSVRLVFSATAVNRDYALEVFGDHLLASSAIRPAEAGAVTCDIAFTVDATADHPISVRLSMARAAFDGTVLLENVTLEPVP